mgnify:CR=1 FL=1
MSRSWVEKFAVFAMALGLVALAAVSVAALLIAAGVLHHQSGRCACRAEGSR